MRLPYAAKTLISEVQQINKRAKATAVGEPDGFGVQRSITFDKATSKRVEGILEKVDDRRISGVEMSGAGVLKVTFSGGIIADSRASFHLNEADLVNGD